MNDSRKPVVFLHIPKTAGTSLIELVSRNFGQDEVLRITDVQRPIAEITAEIELALAAGARFICGHFPFAVVAPLGDDVQVFTMLRDPVERMVSLYTFWRFRDPGSDADPASQFCCQLARSMSFGEFLACEHPLIVAATRDEMCKQLRPALSDEPGPHDPAELFARSRTVLQGMCFGMVGQLDRSLRLLSRQLSLNLLAPVRLNTTDALPKPELTPAEHHRATLCNLADTMLHEFAGPKFDRLCRTSDLEALHREIGEHALTSMAADGNGGFVWDASMAISGKGWNDRERLSGSVFYRFSSTPETIIDLPNRLAERPFTITVDVVFFHDNALVGTCGPLHTMQFDLNGRSVDAQARPGETGISYHIRVERGQVAGPILSLAMHSQFGLSPVVFGSPDTRNLLAAIRSIRLT